MTLRLNLLAAVCLGGQALCALAQVPATPVPTVTVNGAVSDIEAGRDFVAGKIIIGRQRIEASGVRTVEELLKREPAVTVSGDGRIGLLNLPGYTQVLVDGQAPVGGQSPARLDLIHVEKIEIVKSGMAEYGPFGIAGTINILTRKSAKKTATSVSGGVTGTDGRLGAELALSHNESTPGSSFRFAGNLSANRSNTSSEVLLRQTVVRPGGGEQAQWQAQRAGSAQSSTLTGSMDLSWQESNGETVSLSPQLLVLRGPDRLAEARRYSDGRTLDIQQETRSTLTMMSLPLRWSFKPGPKSSLELSARASGSRLASAVDRRDVLSADGPVLRDSTTEVEARATNVGLTYRIKLDGGHTLKTGASLLRVREDIGYRYRIDGVADTTLNALGTSLHSTNTQLRAHVQDEWRIDGSLALSAGLAGADDVLDLDEELYRGAKHFRVWSPSFHVSKKIGGDDKRQLRLSLARSFKAPVREDFTLRPLINPLAPCPAAAGCGPNTIDTADKAGNLQLRPERSLGLNLSYAHGLGEDSQLTLEFFSRRIDGKVGRSIMLDDVAWSTSPRYVSRPTNLGDATSAGASLEWELAVRDLSKTAPEISLRGNLGLASSHIDGLPGPDNRLDKQTPWNAKFGATYTMQALPVKFDVDANWAPSVWVRTSLSERLRASRRANFDASATWSIGKDSRLIMNALAGLPRAAQDVNEYGAGGELLRVFSRSRKFNSLAVRYETKL